MGDSRRDIRLTMATAALKRTSFNKLFDEIGTVDQVGIEERVAKFTTRSIKKKSKLFGLKLAVSMVDLTTLEGKDTPTAVVAVGRETHAVASAAVAKTAATDLNLGTAQL